MTDLARSRGDQFIDRLSGFTEVEPRPEPGYRRRPKPDWLSEFSDERTAAVDEFVPQDPPVALDLASTRTMRRPTTGRVAGLAPMVLLAAVAAAIGLRPSIVEPGDLPVVRRPALAELAPPPIAFAPLPAAEPRVLETSKPSPTAETQRPSARQIPEIRKLTNSSLPVSPSTSREVETAAVQNVLDRYRAAFGTLSTAGIEDFWPSADTPTLARTFDQLRSQRLDFHACGVELSAGGRASARCTGRATFVTKVGGRAARVESRAWSFGLLRVDDHWIIVSVQSRRV
jgi:hypothetical protein